MKRLTAMVLAGVMMLSLGGCGNSSSVTETDKATVAGTTTEAAAGVNDESPGKILFLQTHNNNSFMSYMGEVFLETAKEYGFECDHLTADSDEAKQLAQIEQGIASKEYVGIICDCTGEGVTQGFKEAKEAGLFVMTLHEGVEDNT